MCSNSIVSFFTCVQCSSFKERNLAIIGGMSIGKQEAWTKTSDAEMNSEADAMNAKVFESRKSIFATRKLNVRTFVSTNSSFFHKSHLAPTKQNISIASLWRNISAEGFVLFFAKAISNFVRLKRSKGLGEVTIEHSAASAAALINCHCWLLFCGISGISLPIVCASWVWLTLASLCPLF